MTEPTNVQLVGGRKLRKELKAAGLDLAVLREAHLLASRTVTGAGKGAAPKRSGKLAGSHRATATRASAEARAGGSKVPYANPIHWGWKRHNIAKNPWLSRAAQRSEPTWIRFYEQDMNDAIDSIKGLGR